MNHKTKDRLIFFGIYSLLIISAVGTMAGTYAWYEYSSRATASFRGTAIKNANKLEIGVISSVPLSEASDYGLIKDNTNPNLYWSGGGISSEALGYFLRANGYATNVLAPVTTGSYAIDGEFNLKTHPIAYENNLKPANRNEYCYMPLAFRVNNDFGDVKTFDVKLTDAFLSGLGNIKESARIYFANANHNFVLSPMEKSSGSIKVGGALDLSHDGYRDYTNDMKEYPYGEWDELVYKSEPTPSDTPLPKEQWTTFNGVSKTGTYAIDDVNSKFKTTQYLGRDDVLSKIDVASASEATDGLAFCDVTIYLEGWSLSTIDSEENNYFNLDLQFELFND